jgi:hypothetical protein
MTLGASNPLSCSWLVEHDVLDVLSDVLGFY